MKDRFARRSVVFVGLALALLSTAKAADHVAKLIEFGWDEPSTRFMREHIAEMERTPFDGVVFNIDAHRIDAAKVRFTWEGWGTNAFQKAELEASVADLKATPFKRLTDNFLRFNTTPAKLDWFDDYSAVLNNCRVAAWAAKQGGVKGILFDIEQYEGELFDFRKQRDATAKGWTNYAAQVRRRGSEVMAAFQQEYPGAVIFLTFGYSLPWAESAGGKHALAQCHYGLLAPFLDGMVDAVTGTTLLVEGNEGAYSFRDTNRFAASYRALKQEALGKVVNPKKYEKHMSVSFGLWMDYDWRKLGWNETNVTKNFYTPEGFEQSVRTALRTADHYVWIYTEQPRWWSAEGKAVKLPQTYDEAVRRAKAK